MLSSALSKRDFYDANSRNVDLILVYRSEFWERVNSVGCSVQLIHRAGLLTSEDHRESRIPGESLTFNTADNRVTIGA